MSGLHHRRGDNISAEQVVELAALRPWLQELYGPSELWVDDDPEAIARMVEDVILDLRDGVLIGELRHWLKHWRAVYR